MASRGVSDAEAFAIMKKASNDSNRKLRELAADLLASTTPVSVDRLRFVLTVARCNFASSGSAIRVSCGQAR